MYIRSLLPGHWVVEEVLVGVLNAVLPRVVIAVVLLLLVGALLAALRERPQGNPDLLLGPLKELVAVAVHNV